MGIKTRTLQRTVPLLALLTYCHLLFRILENIVYLELLRRDYKVTVGRTGDKAIDFVCDKSGEKLYVQVAYLLASDETVQREFGAYNNIRDFLLAEEW